jgi:16S rRNA (cytosine1402-N4)-methyltransferase
VSGHVPVLLAEVVAALRPTDGKTYVDGTFGRGGYSRALLEAASCRVVGIDRDPEAVASGAELARRYEGRLEVVEGRFGDMGRILGGRKVAGVALDLGVSSPQLDDPARGFSFREDGPLDMRMGRDGTTAADLVNTAPEAELARLVSEYGEERFARRIARAIVERRPFATTGALAETVRGAIPVRDPSGLDPATRTFQALRIAVNEELDELDRGLAATEDVLEPGGRLAVVSFHSLEDRRVKDFLRERSGRAPQASRHMPAAPAKAPRFRLVTKKPIGPGEDELRRNPRARSARLRVGERTEAA